MISLLVFEGPAFCQRAIPLSPVRELYAALICGTDLGAGHEKQLFIETGLIYLMVMSGSHLLFIERMTGFLPKPIRFFLLAGYCYLTAFHAPVIRAFLRRALRFRALTRLQVEALSVVLVLAMVPDWFFSRSFLMSWMCGLALAIPPLFPAFRRIELTVKIYFFLLPFCWASPLIVGWNVLLAPLFGLLIFPACVLTMIFPMLTAVTDLMWRAILWILEVGPHGDPLPVFLSSRELCWLPVVTHFLFLAAEVKWRRVQAFSCSSR